MELNKTEVVVCDCWSSEHQFLLTVDEEDGPKGRKHRVGYIHPHLVKKNFWYRLKYGIRYIFGRKSRYGVFDEVIITKGNIKPLEEFVRMIKEKPVKGKKDVK
jgi:hypothetical protein